MAKVKNLKPFINLERQNGSHDKYVLRVFLEHEGFDIEEEYNPVPGKDNPNAWYTETKNGFKYRSTLLKVKEGSGANSPFYKEYDIDVDRTKENAVYIDVISASRNFMQQGQALQSSVHQAQAMPPEGNHKHGGGSGSMEP